MGFFGNDKSFAELQEEDEKLEVEVSIAEKKAALKELKEKTGNPFGWKAFSSNGTIGGINWRQLINWLRHH